MSAVDQARYESEFVSIWSPFSPQQQLDLVNEDLRAGYSVPFILMAPMLVGVVLAIVTLWFCL